MNKHNIAAILFLPVFILSACINTSNTATGTEQPPGNEWGYADFKQILIDQGAEIKHTGSIDQSFFPVEGQIINLNGSRVEIYEYPASSDREAVSADISKDGSKIGQTIVEWISQPNFWAKGRLIVLYVGKEPSTIDLLTKSLGTPLTDHPVISPPDPPFAVIAAEQALSQELGLPVDRINYTSYERADWPNSCLGLAEENEICAEVITPGWKITLEAEGNSYLYRADQNGDQVRKDQEKPDGDAGSIQDSTTVSIEDLEITTEAIKGLYSALSKTIIEPLESDGSEPYWQIPSSFLEIQLNNYPLADTFQQPRIYVLSAAELENEHPPAAAQIAAIRSLLEERPLLTSDQEYPFLPLWNAEQVIQTNLEYWAFNNGMGIRYITQYNQAETEVTNQELFYTFQGLTSDGKYYLAAVLPVSLPGLPDMSSKLMADNPESYLIEIENYLNSNEPANFQPDLSVLDHFIGSLTLAEAK
jgi:hypothetical protein